MDITEITNYCLVGSGGICIYRQRVKKAQFIIQNIIIFMSENRKCEVHVEFDPMGLVDQGEGIRWASRNNEVEKIITSLEQFIGKPITGWENYTKTGFEPYYDSEKITNEHYLKSWNTLERRYDNGELLLPKNLKFELLSIIT